MAIYCRKKAFEIYEKSLDANHPDRVECMDNMAILKSRENCLIKVLIGALQGLYQSG